MTPLLALVAPPFFSPPAAAAISSISACVVPQALGLSPGCHSIIRTGFVCLGQSAPSPVISTAVGLAVLLYPLEDPSKAIIEINLYTRQVKKKFEPVSRFFFTSTYKI